MSDTDIVGRCIGEASPSNVIFISKKIPMLGDYVKIDFDDRSVLAIITNLLRGNVAITEDIFDPKVVDRIKSIEGEDFYIRGNAKIIGDLETLEIPKTPPPPGTPIRRADDETLRKVFSQGEYGLRIGTLISHPEVIVELNVNKIVSRHLAILAITGAGKSNAVANLIDEILKIGGCIVAFDMHSEYIDAKFPNGSVNPIMLRINPVYLSFHELEILLNIPSSAYVQSRYFYMAYNDTMDSVRNGTLTNEFFDEVQRHLNSYLENDDFSSDRKSITAVINKVNDLLNRYGFILDSDQIDIAKNIRLGEVNVIDLGTADEDVADVIVSHTLRKILYERKRYRRQRAGIGFPVFLILEEAHILAPTGRSTLSKYWITRIAREGRKFGVGLCLVSQRPKALDSNALSQANNMIILKLVEPGDQRHVQSASETLSEDLLEHLSSFNIGEAVLLGMMTKVPALVKIDKFQGELSVGDIDIVKKWKEAKEEKEKSVKDQKGDIQDIMGGEEW
ncbi:MAG: ATP-binding protein [Candidatus Helarchaeota archaeon]|nr:ATP-binding protein [Candidatus Helarchaeota archaeon]